MHNPRHTLSKLRTRAFMLVIAAILLPVLIVGVVLLFGQSRDQTTSSQYGDYLIILFVVLLFFVDWLVERPFVKSLPKWVQKYAGNAIFVTGICAVTAWYDVDPALTGFAWLKAFSAEFALMMVVLAALFGIWQGVIRLYHHWKTSKDTK